MATYSYY